MQDAYAHCETLVREADKDRFLAGLFVPAERRRHVFALYAFNAEIACIREVAREPLPGELRLQWWRDTLAGQGHGEVAAHPVARALLDTIARHALPLEPLNALVDARTFDLYDDPMASIAEVEDYARKTSSALILSAARILDAEPQPAVVRAAESGGIAYALAGILRAFSVQPGRWQAYLPEDLLVRHDVRRDDIATGVASSALAQALAELRGVATAWLDDGGFAQVTGSRAAAALLPLALVSPLLGRLQRQDRTPLAPVELPQWRGQWALWRAARRLRG